VQTQPHPLSAAPAAPRGLPFQVRGSLQTVLSLRLIAPEDPEFFALLLDKIAHSPDFFRAAPVVLDVGPIAGREPLDLAAFAERLREHRLSPVGIQSGSPAWNEAAVEAGLAVFGAGKTAPDQPPPSGRPAAAAAQGRQPSPPPPPAQQQRRGASLTVREPVRGGQQVVAPDGDLVVTATVGNGAEIAAAGNVHVYGTLRGRAFAGIEGDETAMIFCDQLEAELLSIAGVHVVNEEIDPRLLGRRARVRLERDRIVVQPAG
jgi:septum site-determining protein MinC